MAKKPLLKLGLTGGIGCGKSTVADLFSAKGIDIINVDTLSRACVAKGMPALEAIRGRFGNTMIQPDGQLDRRQLRTIIFNSTAHKQWLETLLHPKIRTLAISHLEASQSPYCILESPLLFETHQDKLVNQVIVVDIPEPLQIQRASARDKLSASAIKKVMSSQLDRASRLARADHVISNAKSLANTARQVDKLHSLLMSQI